MSFSTSAYKKAIDDRDVENAAKYQPSPNGTTYCNIFAQDVASDYGTPLPSGTCSTMLKALYGNNTPHWYSVTYSQAQSRANQGYTTIGITSDHIVIIYPHGNTPSSVSDLYMSMAGYKCFNDTKITYAWKQSDLSNVKFYSWYE
ncbi:hypothetical protein [Geosporobacter ferrireducens]|uniref:Uncharacterized protein n=1 Tax=Geosporobacter ferrireducens TaxID=1424294 RepID=A0A1D8GGF2_9FIRM|nr:hypothetical protein [Geosporobacter ferrireducens]AOT69947.1 hypothetical protein Gferi_10335 [Geosporobacter ferrireducens]MTI54357.1 hypothetical protein [Geosporobacter ferrireducens]